MAPDPRNEPGKQAITPHYTGQERRAMPSPGDLAFQQAVTAAAAEAAQRVSRIHRVRLVTQAGLASFAASAIVMASLGQLYRTEARSDSASFARSNCALVQTLSRVTSDFIETDANLRTVQQKSSVTGKLLKDFAKTIPNKDLQQAVFESNFDNKWTINRWRNVDERELVGLTETNCQAQVR